MKHLLTFILILSVCIGCTSHDRKWLALAEQTDVPAERLDYLNRIDFPLKLQPADKALYGFLLTLAHVNLNSSTAEDSLILFARDYYESHPKQGFIPQVYELSAEYYDGNRMYPQKLNMLRKGLDYSKEIKDSFLVAVFHTKFGYHYYRHKDYRQVFIHYKESLPYHTFIQTYYMMALAREKTGRDSLDYYYTKSISVALEQKDTLFACHYLRNYAQSLAYRGLYKEALKQLTETERLSDYYINYSISELIKAEIYLRREMLDSAQYHLDIAREQEAFHKSYSQTGYKDLSVENSIAYLQSTIDYARYKRYNNSEISQFNDSIINEILFDKQLVAGKQEAQLRLEKQHFKTLLHQQKTNNLFVTGILICIIIIGLILFWVRRRKEQLIEAQEYIETLKNLLHEVRKDKDDNQDTMFKKVLLQQLGVIRLVAASPSEQNKALLKNISALSGQPLPSDALLIWNDLYPVINSLYDQFYNRLMQTYGELLTEKEIQLCCLLKAGFSTKEICVVTQQSTASVYQRKTTIRKKLGMDEKEDIIEFISPKIPAL